MKRFILLKNNKIIDTSKCDRIEQEKQLDGHIEFHTKDGWTHRFKISFIEKESDNLIDLIEVGDLITYKLTGTTAPIYYNEIHSITVDKNGKTIRTSTDTIDEILTILKIYKPNGYRGYDLAWEKVEE